MNLLTWKNQTNQFYYILFGETILQVQILMDNILRAVCSLCIINGISVIINEK